VASRYLFTTRAHGVSAPPFESNNLALHVGDDPHLVMENRKKLAHQLDIEFGRLFFMTQTHGVSIVEIDESSDVSALRECDAMITQTPGVALAVLVADCAPVVIIGEQTSAVVHVGWRGLFGGIVEKVLERFSDEPISAHIGPTICGECYEIGDDLSLEAKKRGFTVGQRSHSGAQVSTKQTLDIPHSIISILRSATGSRVREIEWNGVCTLENHQYFSYRRDSITGRQAGIVIHGS
jgi:YfiH family protein